MWVTQVGFGPKISLILWHFKHQIQPNMVFGVLKGIENIRINHLYLFLVVGSLAFLFSKCELLETCASCADPDFTAF